jgi:hypothetical protein
MEGMSISVELERVQDEAAQRSGIAYLLTVTDDGRPHVIAVSVDWEGTALVMGAGRGSCRNATARPRVSVLWPPDEPGGYSLIADGHATVVPNADGEGGTVTISPTRAVLHRPGTSADPNCRADCVPLLKTSSSSASAS